MKPKSFPLLKDAYKYFYKQASKKITYIGLLLTLKNGFYEVRFTPPKERFYSVIKLTGKI